MTTSEIIQIITATVGVMCFSLLGNTRGKKLLFTAIGGFLSWALFILLGRLIASETMRYFIVSILLSAYSEIMARVLKTPTTTFIIPSLIPLIPGSSL
ncbi:MAG: threonine/serine exporter family protein, partial [Clostridia bacterium]|nr:threonine/serine exporter family protein [Clostridia bacterium]